MAASAAAQGGRVSHFQNGRANQAGRRLEKVSVERVDLDLDLRKLRYFVAVAEELNFGRAAERLHITQPVLSRQIRSLEDELGVEVFDRSRRGTLLTPAGEQLFEDAVPLLASARALLRRVKSAAQETPTLTIGFMPGITVTSAMVAFTARHPEANVRLLRTSWDDQVEVLRDGRADVSVVRLPIDQHGLRVKPLFQEPRVVVLPAGHRLADRTSVTVADLAPEHLLQDPDAVPEWRDVALELRGNRRPEVPAIHQVEEKLELVAAGAGVCVIPLSTARFYIRPDVISLPVEGLGPNEVALAWVASRRSPLIDDFAETAAGTLARAAEQPPGH
ncbi:LysR substrate-binding domain-containing protein [Streptomyces gramineus]|uniref:LysR family transcriptional regulator n=1 Tax=Streptomyces gramineus TaxID=910542 RepID=UPI00398AA135